MKNGIVRFLAVIGGLTIVLLIIAIISIFIFTGKGSVPGTTILEANFEQGVIEYVPDDPLARTILGEHMSVRDIVDAIDRASTDDRVVSMIARIGAAGWGLAQIQEVRDAVISFHDKGKKAVAYAETFGEFGPGNGAYYLATAFDEIYLQPSGDIGLTGLIAETPFLRGTLDKLDIEPEMDHRKEYKNAMNMLTEKDYTQPHKEATQKVLSTQFNQVVRAIAEARGFTKDEVQALINRGPYLGNEALEAKLVDGLEYRDKVYEKLKQESGKNAEFLYLNKYLERAGRPHSKGKTIALIYGVGDVVRGRSGYDPMFNSTAMGSESITAAFRAAIKDDDVKAILFRVDSPGGSYVASDAIWRATVRAKEAGKPVIVSMGDVAGSGGYFVAMAADKIVAQPGTITGSIGVLGGKMVTTGFWKKLGITFDEVHTSNNSTFFSMLEKYSPDEWNRLQAWLDRVYEDFTSKVASGRKLSLDRVKEIAKGRIWAGEDAKDLGLVDELGGFSTALRLAKKAADIPEEEEVHLKLFPRKKSFLSLFFSKGAESSEENAAVILVQRALKSLQPLIQSMQKAGIGPNYGVLTMPIISIE